MSGNVKGCAGLGNIHLSTFERTEDQYWLLRNFASNAFINGKTDVSKVWK